jgi:hypothetical protein
MRKRKRKRKRKIGTVHGERGLPRTCSRGMGLAGFDGKPGPGGFDGSWNAMLGFVGSHGLTEAARAQPRVPSDSAAVHCPYHVQGRRKQHGIDPQMFSGDFQARSLKNQRPGGFVAPPDGAFGDEAAPFAKARFAGKCVNHSSAGPEGGLPFAQHAFGVRGPLQ